MITETAKHAARSSSPFTAHRLNCARTPSEPRAYMTRTLLTLALLTFPLAACAQDAPPPAEREAPVMTGGWSQAVLTPEIEAVAVWAFNAMDVPGAELAEIEAISQQVVAGMNYRMDLVLTDGSRWRVQVYQNLSGERSLTSAEQIKG